MSEEYKCFREEICFEPRFNRAKGVQQASTGPTGTDGCETHSPTPTSITTTIPTRHITIRDGTIPTALGGGGKSSNNNGRPSGGKVHSDLGQGYEGREQMKEDAPHTQNTDNPVPLITTPEVPEVAGSSWT